jgi:hypothetical protein
MEYFIMQMIPVPAFGRRRKKKRSCSCSCKKIIAKNTLTVLEIEMLQAAHRGDERRVKEIMCVLRS